MPSSHRIIRMTAMVSSIVQCLLRSRRVSNGYATSPSLAWRRVVVVLAQVVGAIALTAELSLAQEPLHPILARSDAQTVHHPTSSSAFAEFLAGGAFALGAHESGHMLFDTIFNAQPGIPRLWFHGLP